MAVTLEEIEATRQVDRWQGIERMLCGCVVNESGQLEQECEDVRAGAEEGRELVRSGWFLDAAGRARLAEIQSGLASHVRKARAAIKKARSA